MQESTADVRRDIEETQARVSQTLAELDQEISSRKEAVKERVQGARDSVQGAAAEAQSALVGLAREHPWYALGAALGLGMLIARSAADEAAARSAIGGTTAAAKRVAGAAAAAAGAGADKAKGLLHRDNSAGHVSSDTGDAFAGGPGAAPAANVRDDTARAGIFYRLQTGLVEAVESSDLLQEMRQEAAKIGRG